MNTSTVNCTYDSRIDEHRIHLQVLHHKMHNLGYSHCLEAIVGNFVPHTRNKSKSEKTGSWKMKGDFYIVWITISSLEVSIVNQENQLCTLTYLKLKDKNFLSSMSKQTVICPIFLIYSFLCLQKKYFTHRI